MEFSIVIYFAFYYFFRRMIKIYTYKMIDISRRDCKFHHDKKKKSSKCMFALFAETFVFSSCKQVNTTLETPVYRQSTKTN